MQSPSSALVQLCFNLTALSRTSAAGLLNHSLIGVSYETKHDFEKAYLQEKKEREREREGFIRKRLLSITTILISIFTMTPSQHQDHVRAYTHATWSPKLTVATAVMAYKEVRITEEEPLSDPSLVVAICPQHLVALLASEDNPSGVCTIASCAAGSKAIPSRLFGWTPNWRLSA